jgi:Fic family protein
LSQGSD